MLSYQHQSLKNEKIVATYVIVFLKDNSVFYNYQVGIRKNNSTSHAIITLVERVSKTLDLGQYVVGVFFTLKRLSTLYTILFFIENENNMVSEVKKYQMV